MLRHLLKLIWKRKSRNLMLTMEILLAFVVVFAIAAFAARSYQLYQLPVGFSHDDVWSINIQLTEDDKSPQDMTIYDKFKRNLQAMPEVEQVAFSAYTPYEMSRWTTDYTLADGRKIPSNLIKVSDAFFAATSIKLVEGRAFSGIDEGLATVPVVVNRKMAAALAPGKSALGVQFSDGEKDTAKRVNMKVVGVIEDFRNQGEFMEPVKFTLVRFSPLTATSGLHTILLKLRPGTPRAFEAALSAQLKLVRNDWTYTISPLSDLRHSLLRTQMTPLIVLSVIASFLLVMVAFGLFGVLWQNSTQRIPEIGLRRAIGAHAGQIYRQIIAEQLLLSSFAIIVALLMLVQLPLTGALGANMNWQVFLTATILSMTAIYLISLLCALYPGWRASRLSPTAALHYE
jgi:putative ABC transport system permease protein